jgi:hypothetical protein
LSLLTIKHIETGGYESMQQAHSVSFHPNGIDGDEVKTPTLIAYGCTAKGGATDEHGVCRYGTGDVFVMNDAGSTVGKYRLSP